MSRKRDPNKPKRPSIWVDPAPYGTFEGAPGNPDEWRAAFGEAMSTEQADEILGAGSPWDILSLSPGASSDDIKKAWRKAALAFHPDKHPADKKEWATEQFLRAKAAYVRLGGKD